MEEWSQADTHDSVFTPLEVYPDNIYCFQGFNNKYLSLRTPTEILFLLRDIRNPDKCSTNVCH